jgi:hypothetical protein
MKTTSQAFVDAYRQAARPAVPHGPAVAPAPPMPVPEVAPWQNIEIATWQLPGDTTSDARDAAAWTRLDRPHQSPPPMETPQEQRVRRRLSEIAAERVKLAGRSESAPPTATSKRATDGAIEWPDICADLLSEASDEYDSVLRSLATSHNHSLVLGIVAAGPRLGCTTTAMCLSLRAAMLGERPLLVDASQHSFAAQLNLTSATGWWPLAELGDSPLRALHLDARTGVTLLPSGASLPDRLEPGLLFELGSAIGTARQKHRVVVADFGCVDDSTSGRVGRLMSAVGVDAVLALVPAGDATASDRLTARLGSHAKRLVGVLGVQNHVAFAA